MAWVENINILNFTVCALKAGRNDRITPDGGSTYVDYIAYQGAPVGAVAGEETLGNWWDGTTCKKIDLPPVRLVPVCLSVHPGICMLFNQLHL